MKTPPSKHFETLREAVAAYEKANEYFLAAKHAAHPKDSRLVRRHKEARKMAIQHLIGVAKGIAYDTSERK